MTETALQVLSPSTALINQAQFRQLAEAPPEAEWFTGQLMIAEGRLVSASHYRDIEIGTNGTLALTGGITVCGHFTNFGTLLPAVHGVTFNGGTAQNLTLHVPTTFAGLTVASNTTLIETVAAANASVAGTLSDQGVIRKRQTVSGLGQHTFGLAGHHGNGADVVVHVTERTGADPLTALQVDALTPITPKRRAAMPPMRGRQAWN